MLEDGEEAGDGEEPDARGQVGQAELSPAGEHRQLHVQAHLDGVGVYVSGRERPTWTDS